MTKTTIVARPSAMPNGGPNRRKPVSATVGVWLLATALIAVLPVLIFATVAAQHSATAERESRIALVKQRTTSIADAIGEFITLHRVLAQTLAQSNRASPADPSAFHALAGRVKNVTGLGTAILLVEKDGQVLINSRLPLATPLPKTNFAPAVALAIDNRKTVVTDIAPGAYSGETRFAVVTPVFQPGQVDRALVITVMPQLLLERMHANNLPEGWIASVIDSTGKVVARTKDHHLHVGKLATQNFLTMRSESDHGMGHSTSREGDPIFISYVTLEDVGWSVGIGVPGEQFDGPLTASRWNLVRQGLAALTAALATALLGGWYINREVRGLRQAADAVGAGTAPVTQPSHVSEINRISQGLMLAFARTHDRELAIRKSEAELRAFFDNAVIGVVQLDTQGRYKNVNQFYCDMVGYSREELLSGMTPHDLAHKDEVDRERELINRYLQGETDTYQSRKRNRKKNGEWIWVRVTARIVRDPNSGERIYSSALIEDITEEQRNAERNAFLMREINHRVKNVLSVVQSVARHTAAQADPAEFAKLFSQRLTGLAASHDLLVQSEWRGVDIGDLVRSQLGHLGDLIGSRIILEGPKIQIKPQAAQSIGLAINELATNAGKYGSLSNDAGTIAIKWVIRSELNITILRLTWTESGGPPVQRPTRRGFGSTVLVDLAEHSLGADVKIDYAPTGLTWQLDAPMSSVR